MTSKFREGKFPEIDHQAEEIRFGRGRGGGDGITLGTLIPVIIIEALPFFFHFHPSAFPWEGQVSVSKKSWLRVNLEPRSHSVGDKIQGECISRETNSV